MLTHLPFIHRIIVVSAIALLLPGCSRALPASDQIDKSPFTGLPCAAPCWHDLMIGKSDENEVMSTISTLPFVDQDMVKSHRMSMPTVDYRNYASGVEITANCIESNKQCLAVKVVDNVLTNIDVFLNYEITADEAIEYLGNPDYIGYDNLGGEQVICGVYLVWNNKQLVLVSMSEGAQGANNCHLVRDTGQVSSNVLISKVSYVSIAGVKNLLATGSGEFFKFSGTLPAK